MSGFEQFFKSLYDHHDINLVYLYDPFERQRFLWSLWTTIKLSTICVVASVVIGLFGAWLQLSPYRILRNIVQGYIQFFRNTPPLIQLYFFYFALSPALPATENEFGIRQPLLSNFAWACISLSFFAGAFNVEIFRSGIEAVPRTMHEAAESLGFTKNAVFRLVTLPLAIRVCIPALSANLINLVKTTTLAYAIAVPEALFVANQIWSDRVNVPEMMITLFVFYMILVGLLGWAMSSWEKALRFRGFKR
jgi:polar amino acid transport system permease protein